MLIVTNDIKDHNIVIFVNKHSNPNIVKRMTEM